MPSIRFGTSSYERGLGGLPSLPVVNMFAEEAPTEETGICLQSRPGLVDTGLPVMGAGPVTGLFRSSGVLNGTLCGVSGGIFYTDTGSYAAVGAGPVSWGAFEDKVFVTAGGFAKQFDGGRVTNVPFPEGRVLALAVGSSRLVGIAKDTQRFYWSDSLTNDVDVLSFATAESSPDRLLDILFLKDQLVLFGTDTVEFWPNTGDNDLPFRPLEGAVISRGIRNTGACCQIGGSFAWVTDESQVCVGSEDNVISNTGLQRRIYDSAECRLFRFALEGNEFIALRLDTETQVYSRRTGMWSEFKSYGQDNWTAQCWADDIFGGSDGAIYEWSSAFQDGGADQSLLERRFRAGFPVNSAGTVIGNMALRCNPGETLHTQVLEPTVEMRISRDGGKTWGHWLPASLGEQGKYREKVQWRGLGMASQPGFFAEFRVTDPAPFRVSDVLVNDSYGGR